MTEEDRGPTRRLRAQAPAGDGHAAGTQIGHWVLGDRLGDGGCGAVYDAEHRDTHQRAALKVLHAHFTTSSEMVARFDREISVLARLQHPNIVQVVDAGFADDGRPYLCMERLVGQDLAARLAVETRLELDVARAILEPLCEAIGVAHSLGVIHRDLKASNVFLSEDGRVVLLDFGIAKISDALAPELTASYQSLGTPGCMAPEQIQGARVDARTDVYALGGLLFQMLTGRMPFHDPSDTMTQYLHLHARRPRVSSIVPLPPTIDDVVTRAMAIEPAQRFPDAHAFISAFRVAVRATTRATTATPLDHAAIYVAIGDRTLGADLDEALVADLETVLVVAERTLAEHGFTLALDLGTSALFVAPITEVASAVAAARACGERLAQRPARDARVRVGICVHRGTARVVGDRVEPCPLVRPETWGMPDPLEGVWVTSAIEATSRRVA